MKFVICEDIIQLNEKIKKLSFSEKKNTGYEFSKVTARPFKSKKGVFWQLEKHKNNQVFHQNLSEEEFLCWTEAEGRDNFRQCILTAEGTTIHYTVFPDKTKRKLSGNEIKNASPESHNKEKSYILKQGDNIPALVDLGVFSKDFQIIKSKYDKYKQIDRFIEIVDDAFRRLNKDTVTILDFGCGKSYLTFIIYHYFTVIKGVKAKVLGFDLKEDVVQHCNEIAEKYGYTDLKFYVNDVTKGEVYKDSVDMVITLHACDTATDYAIYNAIKWNAKMIFSVPCCQHEINSQIYTEEYSLLTK